MKVHGAIAGGAFTPYFVLEAFGISLPLIGLTSLDSTYAWSPMVQLLLLMLACFAATIAYVEFTQVLPEQIFCYCARKLHPNLHAALVRGQCRQPHPRRRAAC